MRLLLIILTSLTAGQLFACGDAYQHRLFPIGTSKDKIVIIETSLYRHDTYDTVGAPDFLEWRGTIVLKSLDKKGNYATIQRVDSIYFLNKYYIKELTVYFQKALHIAQQLQNFVKADNQVIEFCNFKTDCKLVDLKTDTASNKLSIQTTDKKEIDIKYPETIITFSENIGGISNQVFKINSIRKIKIGDSYLLVVDCASGEEHNSQEELHPQNQQQCSSPADCIYPEIVLYHGQSFDTIIRTN